MEKIIKYLSGNNIAFLQSESFLLINRNDINFELRQEIESNNLSLFYLDTIASIQ